MKLEEWKKATLQLCNSWGVIEFYYWAKTFVAIVLDGAKGSIQYTAHLLIVHGKNIEYLGSHFLEILQFRGEIYHSD